MTDKLLVEYGQAYTELEAANEEWRKCLADAKRLENITWERNKANAIAQAKLAEAERVVTEARKKLDALTRERFAKGERK